MPEDAFASLTDPESGVCYPSIASPMDDRNLLGRGDLHDRTATKPRIYILDKPPPDLVEITHGPMRLLFADPGLRYRFEC